jgi:hypothetical protein
MRTIIWRALAIAAAVACENASTRGEDVKFSDAEVRPVSYETSVPHEMGAIRAAFLQDEPVASSREPGRLRASVTSYDVIPQAGQVLASDQCATCGGDSCGCANGSQCASSEYNGTCETPGSVYFAEVQILYLRAHVLEDAVGKLSEQYKWSPRVVAGYENEHGIGGRGRWWHYSHETPILGGDDIRFRFDTIDAEATARFASKKADLVVSGGMRWADIEIEFDDDSISTGAPGLTAAADLRVEVCSNCDSQWAAIGGARFSTLGGDWDGNGGFIDDVRDDNIVAQELYIGVEYTQRTKGGHDIFARLTYEIQNWHSDAFAQDAGADSVGFVGPGAHLGASF